MVGGTSGQQQFQ